MTAMPVDTGFLVRCTLRTIACQLVETVPNNVTIDRETRFPPQMTAESLPSMIPFPGGTPCR